MRIDFSMEKYFRILHLEVPGLTPLCSHFPEKPGLTLTV